jgi:predicted regulator of Ras-like GTPase activity (Roadblock/LC7/MglB family)
MASTPKELLNQLMQTEGAMCAALVDYNSGMLLESVGTGVDLDMAAAGNTEVVRAKMKTMKSLGLDDTIEDILISLGKHYHIIRPVAKHDGLFIYYVLDRNRANLAMARRKVLEAEAQAAI